MSWTHANASWKGVLRLLLPPFVLERCCAPPGPYQTSVTPMVDELLFPVQMKPYNMFELKVGVYIWAGV